MVTRKLKATVVGTPVVEATYSVPAVSWQRQTAAWIGSLAISLGVGYVGGSMLAHMLIGATVLGTSGFVALLMYVLGLLLAVWISHQISGLVFTNIMNAEYFGIKDKAVGAYHFVRGKLGNKFVTA